MFLAVLHLAFDGEASRTRRAHLDGLGWGVQALHPTGAALSALREFPPDVIVFDAGSRPAEALPHVLALASEPHRRGGHVPILLLLDEARPDVAALVPPSLPGHVRSLHAEASPAEVVTACLDLVRLRREDLA